jgi:cytochrome b involved in lipid metabolism
MSTVPAFVKKFWSRRHEIDRVTVIIEGDVYDVTDFVDDHPGNSFPGGGGMLKQYNGQDVTTLFNRYHMDAASAADQILKAARDEHVYSKIRFLGKASGASK